MAKASKSDNVIDFAAAKARLAADEDEFGLPLNDAQKAALRKIIDDELARQHEKQKKVEREAPLTTDDFLFFVAGTPGFICIPTGNTEELWTAKGVDLALPWLEKDDKGKPIPPSQVIANNPDQQVVGMTWWPGKDKVIRDTIIKNIGKRKRKGAHYYNRYDPPDIDYSRKAKDAQPWLDHVALIYPHDWQHLVKYFAHKVQHPGVKIMHAIVLGGATRIGKDTMIKPVAFAIGHHNFTQTDAETIMDEPRYNGFLEGVLCVINEAKDFGEFKCYAFYERVKPWLGGTAAGVLMVADKYVRRHAVIDVFGPIITTNHKIRGLYLPSNDARHYVAWSLRELADWGYANDDEVSAKYFRPLYQWFENGGNEAVAYYLENLDLSADGPLGEFDPNAPPPKTDAWWEIVKSHLTDEQDTLANILADRLGSPRAVTVREVNAADTEHELGWTLDNKSRSQIPGAFEAAGYIAQRNPDVKSGAWWITRKGKRAEVTIYVQSKLSPKERLAAARAKHKDEAERPGSTDEFGL